MEGWGDTLHLLGWGWGAEHRYFGDSLANANKRMCRLMTDYSHVLAVSLWKLRTLGQRQGSLRRRRILRVRAKRNRSYATRYAAPVHRREVAESVGVKGLNTGEWSR